MGSGRRDPLLTLGLLTLFFWGLSAARSFVVPVAIAAVIALFLAPAVRWLARKRVPDGLAIAIAALALLLPITAIAYFAVLQAQSFSGELPAILSHLFARLQGSGWINLSSQAWVEHILSAAGAGMSVFLGGVALVLSTGAIAILILVMTITLLGARDRIFRVVVKQLSQYESLRGPEFVAEVTGLVERFLLARAVIAAIVCVVATLVLMAFRLPYSFFMGALIGAFTALPAVGFVLSLIPPVVVSLAMGKGAGATLGLVAAFIPLNLIESYVLTPKLAGGTLNINALATIIGLLAGGLLWGPAGMILSVPILAILRIVFAFSERTEAWADLLAERDDEVRRRLILGANSPMPQALRRSDPRQRERQNARPR